MAGNAKRATKKLKEIEAAFVSLPPKHRTRPVFQAIAKVSGVPEKRADEYFRLSLSLLEASQAQGVLNG